MTLKYRGLSYNIQVTVSTPINTQNLKYRGVSYQTSNQPAKFNFKTAVYRGVLYTTQISQSRSSEPCQTNNFPAFG